MLARKYAKKIQIWQNTTISDGFGGNTIGEPVLVGSFFAEILQNSAFKDVTLGQSNLKNNYTFRVRESGKLHTEIEDCYIVFRDKKYVIKDIRYDDELFRFLIIQANGG